MDQLRHQRNLDDSINTCTGFYFPNNASFTSVIKVILIWSDGTTDFRTTNHIVAKTEVIKEISTAIQTEKKKSFNVEDYDTKGDEEYYPETRIS